MEMIEEYLPQKYYRVDLLMPYTKGDMLSNLFDNISCGMFVEIGGNIKMNFKITCEFFCRFCFLKKFIVCSFI